MEHKKLWLLMIVLAVVINSCEEDESLNYEPRGKLISTEQKTTVSVAQVIQNVDELSLQGIAQYNVELYTITYRTVVGDKQIDSKGMIMVPQGVDTAYLLAYFHGTQLPINLLDFYDQKNVIPSNYDGGAENFSEIRNMGLSWASAGYTVFLPDYIGFGETLEKEHPYLCYSEMFKSNIDGLLATKQFIASKGKIYDNRLFLTGWSQGGGACLSAHKFIQEQYSSEFTVVASSSLAGPHNFARFVDDILSRKDEELNISNIFSWAFYALNKYTDLKRPTDQLYAYPVYDQFAAIFPPSKKPSEIFNSYFLSKIINGSDKKFRTVMNQNTFASGWTPTGKVFLHHGDADDVVYYFNSVDAKNNLSAAGGDVTLYTYPGGTHDSELDNFIAKTLTDFNTLK